MITYDNINDVIKLMSNKDIKRLKNSDKEYVVLYLSVFNTGCVLHITLTNDFNRYKNVGNNGNCILEINDPIFSSIIQD